MNKSLKLLAALGICLLTGYIGSYFTTPYIQTWYSLLDKPIFNPPNWLFAPAWTVLYVLMGVSLYLIISKKKHSRHTRNALIFFFSQLILNIIWSVLFFSMQQILPAFLEIISVWTMLTATMLTFYKIDKTAAYLLLPAVFWVAFALTLNYSLFLLNVL